MNVNEARSLINGLQEDLAAEPDPRLRSWYEEEAMLLPDYDLAKRTLNELANLALLIGKVADIKNAPSESQAIMVRPKGVAIEGTDEVELPSLPTSAEKLHRRIDAKYYKCKRQYENDLRSIKTAKKSKREHLELMARRKFARTFCDFKDINGQDHLILQPALLDMLTGTSEEGFGDPRLGDEVVASCAKYVEKNAVEYTSDPVRFASLIQNTVRNEQFEPILRAVFKASAQDLPQINLNLAHTAFEMLGDREALSRILSIFSMEDPYVPITFASEAEKQTQEAIINGDLEKYVDLGQIQGVYHLVAHDILREWNSDEQRVEVLKRWYRQNPHYNPMTRDLPEASQQLLGDISSPGFAPYRSDPVISARLDGSNPVPLTTMPSELMRGLLDSSDLFLKRMLHLAPYSYSQRTALRVLPETPGQYSQIIPLSPDMSIDIYLPISRTMSEEEMEQLKRRIREVGTSLVQKAVTAKGAGRVKSYETGGELSIAYDALFEDEKDGIVVYRPSVSFDARTHSPLQSLAVNTYAMVGADTRKGMLENFSECAEKNVELRQAIQAERTRFFGRRPVKFNMPSDYRDIGFNSVDLRLDADTGNLKARFNLMEGDVELDLDREFNILDAERVALVPVGTQEYYENLVLRLAKEWMCKYEVNTSEGVISEKTKNSANMGHFGYLQVRPADGYKYHFRPPQVEACLKEQNLDLATESERRKSLDPTGQERNSTYIKESYDPSKPPLVVYATI